MWSLLCLLFFVPFVQARITDFKSDARYNATYLKNDVISHVAHLFPSINADVMSHTTQAEQYQLKPIRATLALVSQRHTPFFSWMDAKYALSINRLNQCAHDQIQAFTCLDCDDMKLKFVYSPPSGKDTRVLIVATETFLMVGFQGPSRDIPAWLADLNTQQTEFPCVRCLVNRDFYHPFTELVDPVVDAITELHELNPLLPIYLSGHSVGAALATLFAVHVNIHSPSLPITHVFTFGSPRVGNKAFALFANKMLGERWFRVMNQLDIVASVPPQSFGYHHTGQLMLCNTGTTICLIKGRNEENEGGAQEDLLRLTESTKHIQACHFTYWKETLECTSR